ncbi:MAG: hypothetical protein JXB15_14900 [Anaerolineales bacterium]|nr:hypothetical protein [Anaerolineales bacterium]
MKALNPRLPVRQDLALVWAGCVFVIHLWSFVNLFEALPAWVLHMNIYELAGVIGYVLVFALLESLVVWGVLVLLAAMLPAGWLRTHFLAQGIGLMLVASLFSALVHYNYAWLIQHINLAPIWLAVFLALAVGVWYLAGRFTGIERMLRAILQRIEILSWIYIVFDLLGLVVIIVRNIL